jgi:hypothetical protein
MGCNTHVHGSNARNLSIYLFLSHTSKNNIFYYLLCFPSNKFEEQEGRIGGAPIMCTHVSKC